MKILAVDDEEVALSSLKRLLRRRGWRDVDTCNNGIEAIELIKATEYDVVILDMLMPEIDGLQVLEQAKPYSPHTEFIMVTAVDDVDTVVSALHFGAYDYLVKPVEPERLFLALNHAIERRGLLQGLAGSGTGRQLELSQAFHKIITHSPRMLELLSYTQTMASSGNPILITGESGTGKELLARAVHKAGPTPDGPFVAVNVASVSESLFESQFFGHVKGAFTGATADYPGFFVQANGGTLFLDEIGELALTLQTKFLRVLEEKMVSRLGDPKQIKVDVRIVSATNVDLDEACRNKTFRLDLMYRLTSIHLHLPPLRERKDDIPTLANHFFQQACLKHNKKLSGFGHGAMQVLEAQDFPGNIRELAQKVENGVLMANRTHVIFDTTDTVKQHADLDRSLCTLKEDADIHTAYVLSQVKGNRQKAADILGVSLRQVQRRLADMKKEPVWEKFLSDI